MSLDWSNVRKAMGDDEPTVKSPQSDDQSEFWSDDAAAAASRDEQRQFEERTGMRSPPRRPVAQPSHNSKMSTCWECHKQIGTTAKACPHCGADQSKKPLPMPPLWFLALFFGGIATFIIVAVVQGRKTEQQRNEWTQFEDELQEQWGERFTTARMNSVTRGMVRADVERILGRPTTTIMSIQNRNVVQWVQGPAGNPSSIVVTFVGGKVTEVAGTNLR